MAMFEWKRKLVVSSGAAELLLVVMISAAGGCKGEERPNAVWYQWSKTLEQADNDCRDCYYDAVKYARVHSKPYRHYAPENDTLMDYRERYGIRGHGVGQDSIIRDPENLASGPNQNSYTDLRDRQMNRCMNSKGYRTRCSKDLGDILAIREVPVAGDHWVAGLVADSNDRDPNT
jgi:hypothetical protein